MISATLASHLQRFFTDRLLGQLGASPHTVASYRDTFRLLLVFACKHRRCQASHLRVEDLDENWLVPSSTIWSRIVETWHDHVTID